MSAQKVASRYAKSLLDLAQSQKNTEAVYQDVLSLAEACKQNEFAAMLKSPMISGDKKEKVVQQIFGGKIQDLTYKFIQLLIQKSREVNLNQICSEFIAQFRVLNKIQQATLTTAELMNDAQVNEIKQKFSSWLKPGETMDIKQKVDASLIGGFILEMSGQQIDNSVKKQLDDMKTGLYDKSFINLVINK